MRMIDGCHKDFYNLKFIYIYNNINYLRFEVERLVNFFCT